MSMNDKQIYSGSCACGNVTYNVKGQLGGVTYCHCIQLKYLRYFEVYELPRD